MPHFKISRILPLALAALLLTACAQGGGTQATAPNGVVVEAAPVAVQQQATESVGAPTAVATKTEIAPAAPSMAAVTANVPQQAASAVANASTSANSTAVPTDAEAAFDTLYANANAEATVGADGHAYDPWERYNRRMHAFNNSMDRHIIKPVATVYAHTVPRPVRNSVGNFFRNLSGPTSTLNALLQGKPSQSGASLFRFLVNSTFGIAGFFDVATRMGIPDKSEDFGQTFARWGWKKSRYLELPLFGPRTARDALGMLGDMRMNPLPKTHGVLAQTALRTAMAVNIRAQLLSTDALREGATDDYTLFRDAWLQRRTYMIWGEDSEDSPAAMPPYLLNPPAKKPD